MKDSPQRPDFELEDERNDERYAALIKQSREARRQGDHWAAQQYATAAHKWAIDERTRLMRLEHAREALASAKRQLDTAWNKDYQQETIDELRVRRPEMKRVISVWEEAQERVRALEQSPETDTEATQLPPAPWAKRS